MKKLGIISVVFAGLLFGGMNQADAKSFDSSSFERRINIIVNLMGLMTQFPEFEDRIKPIVNEHLEQLFADLAGESKKRDEYKPHPKPKPEKVKDGHWESDYEVEDVVELEAEPYQNIDGKWQVDIEFDNGKDYRFYVYEIEDEEELIGEIADKIDNEFGFDISDDEVADILEFDEDDDEEFDVEGIAEIEAERYENVDGKWQVDIEFTDGDDYRVYVYDIDDEEELIGEIADKIADEFDIDISDDDVADILEFDEEELEDEE